MVDRPDLPKGGFDRALAEFLGQRGLFRWSLINGLVALGLVVLALVSNRISGSLTGSVQIWLPAGLALAAACKLGLNGLPGIVVGVMATPFLAPPAFMSDVSVSFWFGTLVHLAQQLTQILVVYGLSRRHEQGWRFAGINPLPQGLLFRLITFPPAIGALGATWLAMVLPEGSGALGGPAALWLNFFLGNSLAIGFLVPMVLVPAEKQVPELALAQWRFLGVCALALLCAASGLKMVSDLEARQLEANFGKNAEIVIKGVKASIEDAIKASQVLGDELWLTETLSAQRFQEIASVVYGRYPDVKGMGWLPVVGQSVLSRHVRERRKEGAATYDVFEISNEGAMVSVRPRPNYYPVTYVYPESSPNQFAVGYDLNSEPLRRETMLRSEQTGTTAVSPPLRLVQVRGESWAMLAITPVCRKAPRKSNCKADGFAITVLRLGEVWNALRQHYLHLPVAWSATDLDAPEGTRFAYQSTDKVHPPAYNLTTESTQVFGGHRWRISVHARSSQEAYAPEEVLSITALGLWALWVITLAYLLAEREKREAVARLVVQVGRDSEKFQAESRRSKDLLADAVDSISEGFTIYGPDDRLVICNEAYKKIYSLSANYIMPGASFEEILRRGASVGQYGEGARRDVEQWVSHRMERHRLADGTPFEQSLGDGRWLIISERKTKDGYTVGNRIDITHLKKLQQAISKQHDTLKAIMEMSPDGFVGISNDGNVSFANRGFETMTDIAAKSIINEPVAHADKLLAKHLPALSGTWSLSDNFAQALRGEGMSPSVVRVEAPRGRTLQISWIVAETTPAGYLAHFRDISREIELDRMKTDFLAHAAHELRTPMANVFGFAELLMTNDFDAEVSRDIAETIHRQAGRLNQIINEVLDLSRIDSGAGLIMAPTRFDLKALVQDVVAEQPNLATRVGAGTLEALRSVSVFADKTRAAQCVVNVLSNAAKFSPADSSIEIAIGQGLQMGFVSIRDRGIGIRPENISKIGRRFWREDATGKVPGTGLGLAIVKELIARQNGLVSFVAPADGGTEVILCLPLEEANGRLPLVCECNRFRLEGRSMKCQPR